MKVLGNTLLSGDEPFWFLANAGERVVITELGTNTVVFDRTYTSDTTDRFLDDDGTGFWRGSDYRVDVYSKDKTYSFYIHNTRFDTVYQIRMLDYAGRIGRYYKYFVQYMSPNGRVYVRVAEKWLSDYNIPVPSGWSVVVVYKVTDEFNLRPHTYGQFSISSVSSNYDIVGTRVDNDYVVVERTYRIYIKLIRDLFGDTGIQILNYALSVSNPLLAFVGSGIAKLLGDIGVYGVSYVKEIRISGDYVYITVGQTENVYDAPLLLIVLFILLGVLIINSVSGLIQSISENKARENQAQIARQIHEVYTSAFNYAQGICGNDINCVNSVVSTITDGYVRSIGVVMSTTAEQPTTCNGLNLSGTCVPWWGWLLVGLFLALLLRR